MREDVFYKMLFVSAILHLIAIIVFSLGMPKSSKKIDLSSAYSVNLVGNIGSLGALPGGGKEEAQKAIPEKTPPAKSVPVPKEKPDRVTKKPVPKRAEKDEVSLSKKKVPDTRKKTASKEEVDRLEDRIRQMKQRTEYLDVAKIKPRGSGGGSAAGTGGAGLPYAGGGGGGGRPLDLATQRYIQGIWETVKDAWGLPGTAFKKLETIVTIKIRRDGRIVDINFEKRSGNRIYDESILRVLRSVDPFPPLPASISTDVLEIGFRFLPGDLS